MIDILHDDVSVQDPDAQGNYKNLSVKAGKICKFTKPINMCGAFLYNVAGEGAIEFVSSITSPAAANANYVATVPADNGAGVNNLFVQNDFGNTIITTFVTNGATIGTFRMVAGVPLKIRWFIEAKVKAASAAGNADTFQLGIATDAAAANAFAAADIGEATRHSGNLALNTFETTDANLVTQTWSGFSADSIPANNFLCVKIKNSNATRGAWVKYLKVILITSYVYTPP